MERIRVNDESVVEVLMYDAFKRMCLDESLLRIVGMIYGFVDQLIKVKGLVTLSVTPDHGDNKVIVLTF